MRRVVVVMLLSGCSSILGIEDFKVGDAGTGSEMMEQGYCLGPAGWRVCLDTMPTMPRAVDSALNFDTDTSPLCAGMQPEPWKSSSQPPACFVIGSDITLSAPTIRASGTRPLVVFASGTITIASQLDVASHSGTGTAMSTGPGTPMPGLRCVAPGAATPGTGGGGGGAGGSFMTRGGSGGNSSANVAGGSAAAQDTMAPTILRAGCPGGVGGTGAQPGGQPGVGGGAVYLVAGSRIVINGFINASGSAGQGGMNGGGGGGAGSGGMIHLHAPTIGGNGGVLIANGGGGGEGGDPSIPGQTGNDPTPQMPGLPAFGGSSSNAGGAGGNGYSETTTPGATNGAMGAAGAPGAGGGGGGGAGYIRVNVAPSPQVTASPRVTEIPDP